MLPNHSPWIKQLNRSRPVVPLNEDLEADVVIVGGGIAGIMTAYFTLRDTDHAVLLIEGDKVAHGATGHNAGQLVSYFERSFESMVKEFGIVMASEGVRAVEHAWDLLADVVREAGLATPIHIFTGYAGVCVMSQLIEHLEENRLRLIGGLAPDRIIISADWHEHQHIPEQYVELYELAPAKDVLALLETDTTSYIAAVASKKGCANSALLAEELAGYLMAMYPERFHLHEETMVSGVELYERGASLVAQGHHITATRVILATNGFENFTIRNTAGPDIDTSFHHDVSGLIGYMAGYLEKRADAPIAISYYAKTQKATDDELSDDYFYLTRRPFEHEGSTAWTLLCAGGPDASLPDLAKYSRADGCNEDIKHEIDSFLATDYRLYPEAGTEYEFCWHGLMGYTPNLIRRAGVEPLNPVLMYNLGCNGVGLLPSIMGGARLARLLGGETLPPSIFDPVHQQKHSA